MSLRWSFGRTDGAVRDVGNAETSLWYSVSSLTIPTSSMTAGRRRMPKLYGEPMGEEEGVGPDKLGVDVCLRLIEGGTRSASRSMWK